VNFTVKQLFEEKPNKKVCEKHKEKLRLICLTDNCQICDDCFFSEDHKGHVIKPMKKLKNEAIQKRKDLANLLEQANRNQKDTKEVLEERRIALLQVITSKFEEFRWNLAKKELELLSEVNSIFDMELAKIGLDCDTIKTIEKKIADLKNNEIQEDFFGVMEQDVSEISQKINSNFLDEQVEKVSQKFNKVSNYVYERLTHQLSTFIELEFPIDKLLKDLYADFQPGDLNNSDPQIIYDNFLSARLKNVFKFETKDGWLMVSAEANPQRNHRPHDIPINIKEFDKVWLKLGKCDMMGEDAQMLLYLWRKLGQVTSVKVDFTYKDISDKDLLSVFAIIFGKASELQAVAVDLCDCKVTDQSIIPLVQEILPKMFKLKSITLNLNSTYVTDAVVEAFAMRMQPVIKTLENFDIRLWETKVTDKSITKLFTRMEKVKRFILDLGYTGVTNEAIQMLAKVTLPTMKVIEEFKLNLSNTSVSDESVSQIFVGMESAKRFLLYLHGTNITDKSLEAFTTKTLPNLQGLEVFEMRLGETNISDQGVIGLFQNMNNVKKFLLKVQSTSITDRTVDMFTKTILPNMQALKEFDMDVSKTGVSEKCLSQIASIKEMLRE